jgi:hypothetical protein
MGEIVACRFVLSVRRTETRLSVVMRFATPSCDASFSSFINVLARGLHVTY